MPRVLCAGAAAIACAGCGPGAHVAARRVAAQRRPVAFLRSRVLLGRSVEDRRIVALRIGQPAAARSVLVVGCVHGSERAGIAISRALRRARPPAGVALWLVDEFNPDGCAHGTRQNAHGVDLNRNSPWHWRPLDHRGGLFWSGPRPLSEPESRAIHRFVLARRPAISIWYHQHARLVDDSGGNRSLERRYARLTGLPFRSYGRMPGSITSWQDHVFPRDTAFVVELPAGRLSSRALARHVRAVLMLARAVAR